MLKLSKWIPMTRPFPLRTLQKRIVSKWIFIITEPFILLRIKLKLNGAKYTKDTPCGNALLILNKDYPLGPKGTEIEIPKDNVIFEHIRRTGTWELDVSLFLSDGLKEVCRIPTKKVALIDIGANAGLVTLQAMNLSNTPNEVILFEPVPNHAAAIKQNLKKLRSIRLNEFALSDKNGKTNIYTESSNRGNTSLLESVIPRKDKIATLIELVDAKEYFDKNLSKFDSFIIKCDAQGMDSVILARLPNWFWHKCEYAITEVWAIPQTSEVLIDELTSKWTTFREISWSPEFSSHVQLDEIRKFWLSSSGFQRNLFLKK